MLTQERLKQLLHYNPETGVFTNRVPRGRVKAGDIAGWMGANGRRYVYIGKFYLAHRLAFLYMTGSWPIDEVDHLNGDPADNRWINIRLATSTLNKENRRIARSDSALGIMGVRQRHHKFLAVISVKGKQRYLGSFETADAAHRSYIEAKRKYHPGNTL